MNRPWIYLLIACSLIAGACAHNGPAPGGANQGGTGTEAATPSLPTTGLAGTDWMVEEIRGKPVIDQTQTALRFGADGHVSGSTGCNNFGGGATMDAKRLSFGAMATTRKACVPELMTQEQDFLSALGAVRSYSVAPDGALRLLAEDGTPLVRLLPAQFPKQFAPGDEITVKGELVAGTECPMVAAGDGRRYSVAGNLGPYRLGDRVCIKGKIAGASICMAGDATIEIQTIGPESSCP